MRGDNHVPCTQRVDHLTDSVIGPFTTIIVRDMYALWDGNNLATRDLGIRSNVYLSLAVTPIYDVMYELTDPWASCQIRKWLRVAHAPGIPGTFFPPMRVSDPDMHHGTCVTHVPWCMPGSLTSGASVSFEVGGRVNVPSACTIRNLTYLPRSRPIRPMCLVGSCIKLRLYAVNVIRRRIR